MDEIDIEEGDTRSFGTVAGTTAMTGHRYLAGSPFLVWGRGHASFKLLLWDTSFLVHFRHYLGLTFLPKVYYDGTVGIELAERNRLP
ncbi:hypothetical protein [Paenibacillus dendritiformis]|uniref:hypothetical protein n=1 Tax=Paenibacillus dendritiformis TaxID=130049 RepID=UPI0018CF3B4B|nr:hypothetical protein [Paenibacillus dendritiformis]